MDLICCPNKYLASKRFAHTPSGWLPGSRQSLCLVHTSPCNQPSKIIVLWGECSSRRRGYLFFVVSIWHNLLSGVPNIVSPEVFGNEGNKHKNAKQTTKRKSHEKDCWGITLYSILIFNGFAYLVVFNMELVDNLVYFEPNLRPFSFKGQGPAQQV